MADDSTVESRIAEIETRRALRREETAKARATQYEKDLEALDALEVEHGEDRISALKTPSYVAGLPTIVVVKTPGSAFMNRYRTMVRKSKGDHEQWGIAKDLLADTCVIYPDKESYTKMREAWSGIHDDVGVEAIRLGEASGKG